jgi:Na+/pantothenate symporter
MLSTLLDDVPLFQSGRIHTGAVLESWPVLGGVEPGYLLCLALFAVAVIVYTTYGGFRAVVWTDVLQGLVMLAGVLIMLPLALWYVGGLGRATEQMAEMTPPRQRRAELRIAEPQDRDLVVPFGTWIEQPADREQPRRVFRTARRAVFPAGQSRAVFVDGSIARSDVPVLEITTPGEVARIAPPRSAIPVTLHVLRTDDYAYGADRAGVYVSGPGPSPVDPAGFLPLGLAVSFFFMWTFAGAGHPANMVRLMAFRDSRTLKRGIFAVVVYYSLIYFPLVIIFCCARILLPGMEIESDRIMPAMAEHLSMAAGWPWLVGLLVAAPFAAVMSTVDSFLLMVSSALVRDIYHRHINPRATEKTLRRLTYRVTFLIGLGALVGALNPPTYLQDIIVYTSSGVAACFLVPVGLALYWPRMSAAGAKAGMLAGFLSHLALYAAGFIVYGRFQAVYLASFDPLIPAVAMSLLAAVVVSLIGPRPPQNLLRKFFFCADAGNP